MRRRAFLMNTAAGGAAVIVARALGAQQDTTRQTARLPAPASGNTSNLFDMNQDAAKPVRRPQKPGATPALSDDQRDALERQVRCQCGCTLDVYTCRTTDFSCQVSPAMHRDVIALVDGGYSAQEILDAFVSTYGERALMAPKRSGFNLLGYVVPFAVLGVGSVALTVVLRRISHRPARSDVAIPPAAAPATNAELARLRAAIRKDD